jgi:hypothetical protein
VTWNINGTEFPFLTNHEFHLRTLQTIPRATAELRVEDYTTRIAQDDERCKKAAINIAYRRELHAKRPATSRKYWGFCLQNWQPGLNFARAATSRVDNAVTTRSSKSCHHDNLAITVHQWYSVGYFFLEFSKPNLIFISNGFLTAEPFQEKMKLIEIRNQKLHDSTPREQQSTNRHPLLHTAWQTRPKG